MYHVLICDDQPDIVSALILGRLDLTVDGDLFKVMLTFPGEE